MPHADQPAPAKAFISGCAGTELSDEERAFFAEERPFALILFARNCQTPSQIRALIDEFRSIVGRNDAPVLIDQEGGRVQRLKPPLWPAYPPGRPLGIVAEENLADGKRAAWLLGRLIAVDLHELGITVDCLPVLDVAVPGMTDAIGDRSYSNDPEIVAALGGAVAEGLMEGGVLPVVKHIPGHGRAASDSHYDLPVVSADLDLLAETDFVPFSRLAHLPIGMTSHILYTSVDRERPSTLSKAIIRDIIRKRIGFDGLLMGDDISMKALSGDFTDLARATYDAGCDLVLHCNARIEEMRSVALAAPPLAGLSGERAARALSMLRQPAPFDRVTGQEELHALAARGGWPRVS